MSIVYHTPLFRPPSEANSLIIQVTLGCSFNQCSFCSMYSDKQYQSRTLEAIKQDIQNAAQQYPGTHRVFLADGDALNLPTEKLLLILCELEQAFPSLRRVSCYATPANILNKSEQELSQLKQKNLSLLYLGIESGSDLILKKVTKGATQRGIIKALLKADSCRLKVSSTVVLGLGGRHFWREHIEGTVELINHAPMTYLSTLQLYLDETATDDFYKKFGEQFSMQDDMGMLEELGYLISGLNPPKPVIFRSNHASNALALAGTLPKDRNKLVNQIDAARTGALPLRPEYLRSM